MHRGELVAERFEISHQAGAGGMGAVYRAVDKSTGEAVALKVMTSSDGPALRRFEREATLLAALRHPSIVRHIAHGLTAGGVPYLAMEWLEGEDLAKRLSRQPLSFSETLAIVRQAAEALAAAHALGVLHRDIKPSNLFLVGQSVQRVKLLDFGVARLLADSEGLTGTGLLVGTPSYMAPEQARGDRSLSAAADIFALGCLMFRCLTGRTPFVGAHPSAILAKLLLETAPRARTLRPDIPQALDEFLARLLSPEPSLRPADGQALALELSSLSLHDDTLVAPAGKPWEAQAEAAASTEQPVSERLTDHEQRWMCMVMAGAAPDLDNTVDAGDVAPSSPALRALIGRLGGELETLADGTRVVTVIHAGAATDLAARAARCALAMQRQLPGAVLVLATGRGLLTGRLPIGDITDRAAQLLSLHSGGANLPGVWIDEVTASLLDARFVVEERPEGALLHDERAEESGRRRLLGRPAPCVGRERELAALEGHFRECESEPLSRMVMLTAEAGIGKSRLAGEFLSRIDPSPGRDPDQDPDQDVRQITVLRGRAEALGAGSPFAMLARALRSTAGVLDGQPAAEQRSKLERRLAQVGLSGSAVIPFLGELAGVPFPDEELPALRAARHEAALMADRIRGAFVEWLGAECAARPVVLLLDDLHWGDTPSLKLVEAALRELSGRPLLVLALARPEVHSRFPQLASNPALHELRLGPLTRKSSERLVRSVLGAAASEEVVRRVSERAAGHAFLLEELIRAVAAGEKSAWPETVLGMMQARLDALGSEAKLLLRAASLFGERFWAEGVAALLRDEPRAAWLDELCEREICSRAPASSLPGTTEFHFRHALLRDVAYSMLTDSDRAVGHRLAGAWLEKAGLSDALMLAEHYARGGELGRAAHFYRLSAEQSLRGNDLPVAIERAELALTYESNPTHMGRLRLLQAEAAFYRLDGQASCSYALAAMERLSVGSAAWFDAVAMLLLAKGQGGDNEEVESCLLRAAETPALPDAVAAKINCLSRGASQLPFAGRHTAAAEALRIVDELSKCASLPPNVEARVHHARSTYLIHLGNDLEGGLRAAEAGVDMLLKAGDIRGAMLARLHMWMISTDLGNFEWVKSEMRAHLPLVERSGLTALAGYFTLLGTHLEPAPGKAAELRQRLLELLPHLKSARRIIAGSYIDVARLALHTGATADAEADARAALEAAHSPVMRAAALSVLARALLGLGRQAEALAPAREARQLLSEVKCIVARRFESSVYLAWSEVQMAVGEREAAIQSIVQARAWLYELAARIRTPNLRTGWLERIPENARILTLAIAWTQEPGPG